MDGDIPVRQKMSREFIWKFMKTVLPDVLVVLCSLDSDPYPCPHLPIYPSALTHSNSHPFWMVISVMWWSRYSIQRLLLLRSNDHSKSQEVWIHCTLYLQHLSPAAPSRIKFHSRRAVSSWERHQQDLWRMPKTRVSFTFCAALKNPPAQPFCAFIFRKAKHDISFKTATYNEQKTAIPDISYSTSFARQKSWRKGFLQPSHPETSINKLKYANILWIDFQTSARIHVHPCSTLW